MGICVGILGPVGDSWSVGVQVVDKVDDVIGHVATGIDVEEIRGMELWGRYEIGGKEVHIYSKSLTEPKMGAILNLLLTGNWVESGQNRHCRENSYNMTMWVVYLHAVEEGIVWGPGIQGRLEWKPIS